MLSVAWHTLRARWAAFAGSFVALALGVALLTVTGQALAASLDAPERAPERFAAAPVVVGGQDTLRVTTPTGERTERLARPRPVPAGTVAALRALGPVTEDRSFPVRADGAPAAPDDLVGHPWSTARFAPYRLTSGRAPAAADEVVTSGDWATVGTRLRTTAGPLRVVGTARTARELDHDHDHGYDHDSGSGSGPDLELGFEHAVFFPDAQAARLAPESTQLVVEADAAAVRAAVTDENVRILTGDARRLADADPDRDAEALTALNALFGTAGGVTAFVSVFVVASTFAFAVDRRRREFGLLRTAGATPAQLRRSVLAEALLVGTLASATGCGLGTYGAPLLAELVVDGGLAPNWYAIGGPSAGVWPYHLAFWTGLLVALCGALTASWRAGRTAPAQALREASVDGRALTRGRRVCGTALLLAAVATLAYTLVTDPGELLHRKSYISRPMMLITAVALLSPLTVRPLVPRWPGPIGMLARADAVTGVRRTAAVAAPVLVTVALAGSLLGATATIGAARAAEVRQQTSADFVVTPQDGTTLRTGALERLRKVPGTVVSASSATAVFTLEDGVALVKSEARAADPALLAATVRLPVTAGRLADLDDGSIVVTEEWARHRVGQRVRVWLGDGTPKTLRIAAVLSVGTGDNGAYVTPANAGGGGVDRVDVRVRAGADRTEVAARLRTVDGVRVTNTTQWVRAALPQTNRTTRLGMLLVLGIALLYTGISLANTLVMAAAERRPALTALRLTGATGGQVLRLAATEALTAVAVGALLGLLVTVVNLTGLSAALHLLSAPAAIVLPWQAIAWTTAACALLATATALTTTTPALRPTRP
ncbi:FtsX-like permease family protein [Streptomyces rishiriensis]|uniref:ABC transport system permease protein n=1 Tax=Streptomyces rishiriensis TaxID=68264 RepID=A0ABU0NR38_STRRH|nr:ABC transporter permease [Streptomyces rishiriensis]MDQ0581587.1 putative ABC transport system permease protein [Streptomyces rishiriensis]